MMEWILQVIGWIIGAWSGAKLGVWLTDGGLRRLLKGNSYTDFLK